MLIAARRGRRDFCAQKWPERGDGSRGAGLRQDLVEAVQGESFHAGVERVESRPAGCRAMHDGPADAVASDALRQAGHGGGHLGPRGT